VKPKGVVDENGDQGRKEIPIAQEVGTVLRQEMVRGCEALVLRHGPRGSGKAISGLRGWKHSPRSVEPHRTKTNTGGHVEIDEGL